MCDKQLFYSYGVPVVTRMCYRYIRAVCPCNFMTSRVNNTSAYEQMLDKHFGIIFAKIQQYLHNITIIY